MPMGMPGWPLAAFSTASMDSTRMASAIWRIEGLADGVRVVWASATAADLSNDTKVNGAAPLYPDAPSGSIRNLEDMSMADAVEAARTRIDRALNELERKVRELKARPAPRGRRRPVRTAHRRRRRTGNAARVAELETAGRRGVPGPGPRRRRDSRHAERRGADGHSHRRDQRPPLCGGLRRRPGRARAHLASSSTIMCARWPPTWARWATSACS